VHHSWSFKSTLWGYYEMMAGARKLCVTEFGWASTEGYGGTPAGFSFADDNSLEDQAEWIVDAFELQRDWGITWLAFLWNLDFGPKGLGPRTTMCRIASFTWMEAHGLLSKRWR
jgi:polysaccharide biosynthesis protein PslG